MREKAGFTQTELAGLVGMKPSQVSKRETATDRIRPGEYPVWEKALKLPAGSFESEVQRQQAKLEAEAQRNRVVDPDQVRAEAATVIQVVLGEIGPIISEICQNVSGSAREQMLREIVTFAEGMAAASRSARQEGGRMVDVQHPPEQRDGYVEEKTIHYEDRRDQAEPPKADRHSRDQSAG